MAYSFLEPIRVGKMVLKNRIIVPAMARYLCEDGFATEDYIRYYEAMAKGGVAIAVAMQEKLPITYVGLGEKLEDLRPFNGADYARALLGDLDQGK